jgi:uncharacterized integral membrane protein
MALHPWLTKDSPMRFLTGLILLVFLGALLVFSLQNQGAVEIRFLERRVSFPLAGVAVSAYVLGMLSGWSLLRFLRRSVRAVHEDSLAQSRRGTLSV